MIEYTLCIKEQMSRSTVVQNIPWQYERSGFALSAIIPKVSIMVLLNDKIQCRLPIVKQWLYFYVFEHKWVLLFLVCLTDFILLFATSFDFHQWYHGNAVNLRLNSNNPEGFFGHTILLAINQVRLSRRGNRDGPSLQVN